MTQQQAQSPFLPGTSIRYAWDSTCLGALKTCPRMYQYLYLDGWGSKDESVHLRFGIEYHQALQDYDLKRAAGADHEAALTEVVAELLLRTADFAPNEETKAGKYKNRKALLRTVIWYLDEHEDDPAKTYIMKDGRPAVELSFRFELEWGPLWGRDLEGNDAHVTMYLASGKVVQSSRQPYLLCGHLDRIVTFNDSLFVMDHKTTTSTPGPYYFDQWDPNNQMTLYTLASQVIIDSPVKGVIISAAQLLVDSSRFVRGFTFRTPDRLGEWLDDLRYWLGQAESFATANYFPMNDMSCGLYGGCRFREVCSKSPQVREQYLKARFDKLPPEDRWNPLKSRG